MSVARPIPSGRAMLLLAGAYLRGFMRQQLFMVPVIIIGCFGLFALAVGVVGVDDPSTGTFLLNLGLSLSLYTAHALTLLLAARQWPDEIENRTLYPLLARPVSRVSLLTGKWLACTVCGVIAVYTFFAVTGLATPKLETYQSALMMQQLVLLAGSLGMLAMLAMLLSLLLPRGVAALLSGGLFLGGGWLTKLVESSSLEPGTRALASWTVLYLPDFSKFNLVTRFTDGIEPLPAGAFAGLLIYAVIMTMIMGWLAARHLERRVF